MKYRLPESRGQKVSQHWDRKVMAHPVCKGSPSNTRDSDTAIRRRGAANCDLIKEMDALAQKLRLVDLALEH